MRVRASMDDIDANTKQALIKNFLTSPKQSFYKAEDIVKGIKQI